jgi:glycosyltransferase involved in cell wall biosynthesis
MDKGLVSIIIPCYNSANYISETIKSVLAQTYKNFELIIIDDGSTDRSAEIITFFHDERIIYNYQKNSGAPAAKNNAIKKAKGNYISFLDSDDLWEREKIEKQLSIIDRFDAVFCDYKIIDENGVLTGQQTMPMIYEPEQAKNQILEGNIILGSSSSVIAHRKVIEHVGFFSENLTMGEDWDYWFRMIWSDYQLGFIDEKLVRIRMREGSMQTASRISRGNSLELLLKGFLKNKKLLNRQKATVYHTLFRYECSLRMNFNKAIQYYWNMMKNDPRKLFNSKIMFLLLKFTLKKMIWYRPK